MKTSTSVNTQKASPMMNLALIAILILTAIPAVIFGVAQFLPPLSSGSAKNAEVEKAEPKRTSVAERRAQRREAREAKKAVAQNSNVQTTVVTMGPDMGGFGMMPGADMGGFGMMPGADMGGFGMMPGADMGGFGMMPGADMGGFGGGFGGMPGNMGGFGGGFGGMPGNMGGFGGGFGGFGA